MSFYMKVQKVLRDKNISSEIYSGTSNIKSQLKYADKRGCDYVILCGEDEVSKNLVTIKNLNVGKKISENIKDRSEWKQSEESQKTIPFDQLLNELI